MYYLYATVIKSQEHTFWKNIQKKNNILENNLDLKFLSFLFEFFEFLESQFWGFHFFEFKKFKKIKKKIL